MAQLILVKHASPQVVPGIDSAQWELSEQGRRQAAVLADRLRAYAPSRIITSVEPKAHETGAIVAKRLAIPISTAADLHEHDRSNVPHMRSAEFISMVELFFRRPGELVLGRETADQALERVAAAVDRVIADHTGETLAIVTHGTVLSLFVARHGDRSPFELWRQLQLPSFVVMSLPDMKVIDVVARIGDDSSTSANRG